MRTEKEIRAVIFDMNDGLASSVAKRAPEMERKAIEACVDLLGWVVGDPSRFEHEVIPVFEELRVTATQKIERSRVMRTEKEIRAVIFDFNDGLASSVAKRAPEKARKAIEACADLLGWVVGDPSRFEHEVIPLFEELRVNDADPS